MGVVYLCRDDIGRPVAIKTLKAGLPENVKRRFKEEGNRGDLTHDNIVTIYTVSPDNVDPPFIVMEYLDGDPLDKLISGGGRFTLAEKLDVISQVCRGLDYAHSKGVIHRDIKPENIIRLRESKRVKIVDFGISKVKRELDTAGLSQTQGIVGTVGYIAPERWRSQPEDGRVDIFSTGVLLYLLITGRQPFIERENEDVYAIMTRIVNEPYPPLSHYLADYPADLTAILDRALAKEPADRYYTGMEFADDLTVLIDELNRRSLPQLVEEAQRHLAGENWQQVLNKCQEILKLDPQNVEARRLRTLAIRGRSEQDLEQKLQRLQRDAEDAVENKRYDEAIRLLQEVDRMRPGTPEFQRRLEEVRESKRIKDRVDELVSAAEMEERAGDLTGSHERYRQADALVPNNLEIRRKLEQLDRKIKSEEQRKKNERHIFNAEQKIASRQFTEALEILEVVRRSGTSHDKLDALYDEAFKGQRDKEANRLKEQILNQVARHRDAQQYELAVSEVHRGLEALQGDTSLIRLQQEIQSEFQEYKQSKWIADIAEIVRSQSLTSLDAALVTLRQAMREMPGVKTFVALENSLIGRKDEERDRQARAECLRQAGEELSTGRPDRSIQVLESYLLKYAGDADTDSLLEEARRSSNIQRLRGRISECAARARLLLDENRFDEAVGVLEPVHADTQDGELAALLDRALKGKSSVDAEVGQLARHIKELRRENKLVEAISLIESQNAKLLQSPALQELLQALRKESVRNDALAEAMSRSERALKSGEWTTAREPLDDMRRVFGDFDALTQALPRFESLRTREADRITNQSVAAANAAVLAGDKKTAVKALETASIVIPFASAAIVQDWKKRADEFKVTATPTVPGPPPKAQTPLWAAGLAVLILLAVGIVLWAPWKTKEALVGVSFDPPDAQVQIDGDPAQHTDTSGKVTLKVTPGPHTLTVSKDGYSSNSRKFEVTAGGTYDFSGALTDTRTAGYLVVNSGDLQDFEVFVGPSSLGVKHRNEKIEIPAGNAKIHYQAEGYQSSPEKLIAITKGRESSDLWTPVRISTAPKIDSFRVSQPSVEPGSQVVLQWSTTNTLKTFLEAMENGKPKPVGDFGPSDHTQVAVSSDTTFRLIAKGTDGTSSISAEKAVNIIRPGVPAILKFDMDKDKVTAGESVTLSWETNKDTTSVNLDHGIATHATQSSIAFAIPKDATEPITLTITPIGKGGAGAAATKTITVVPLPKPTALPSIQSFTADTHSVKPGDSVTFQWTTKDAAVASLEGNGLIPIPLAGPIAVSVQKTTTFRLVAKNSEGKEVRSDSWIVSVTASPSTPVTPTVDKASLEAALSNFETTFSQAENNKGKNCVATLGGLSVSAALAGPVRTMQKECDSAKRYAFSKQCKGDPNLSDPNKPTWVCDVKITVDLIHADEPQRGDYLSSTFSFIKNTSGQWRVDRWEWH